ncbi:MAG: sigma-E factor negative regulatory protein [Burkholderiaceae bacterium]
MHEDRLTPRQAQQLALSALLDGDASQADRALAAWREEPAARADWHAYQVIGEAMRSDDLNCRAHHDAAFLARVRARLADEPVVLAPAALVAPQAIASSAPVRQPGWRTAWAAPVAVAAGFIAVAGVLVVTRVAAPGGVAPEAASALAGGSGMAPALALGGLQAVSSGNLLRSSSPGAQAASTSASGALIRSADLDRYLAAHRQYSATSSLSVPGGAARNVTVTTPLR